MTAILCYHGIVGPGAEGRATFHVPAEQLDRDLAMLRRMGSIVSLPELLERIEARRPVRGLFAITFDDAYEGVLRLGLPVLEAHRAPATVFAVSAALAGGGRFWWDRLEDLEPRVDAARWREFIAHERVDRAEILARGHGRLTDAQERALASLEREVKFSTPMRSCSADELILLAGNPLITIGPHTVTHGALGTLDDDGVLAEVQGSARALSLLVPDLLPVLAAPYGSGDGRTIPIARRAGMTHTLGVAARTWRGEGADVPLPRFVMSRRRTGARLALQLTGIVDSVKGVVGRRVPDWV